MMIVSFVILFWSKKGVPKEKKERAVKGAYKTVIVQDSISEGGWVCESGNKEQLRKKTKEYARFENLSGICFLWL